MRYLLLQYLLVVFFPLVIEAFQQQTVPTITKSKSAFSSLLSSASSTVDEGGPDINFQSPIMKVFIEDTDAYGIMYNGNYLRSYDRALHLSTSSIANTENEDTKAAPSRVTTNHEGWSIVSLGKQKFVSSPLLGGDFIIQGILNDSSDDIETWDMKMASPNGDIVYNTIQDLQIAKPKQKDDAMDGGGNIFSLQHIEPFAFGKTASVGKITTLEFHIYRDEIDAHWQGHLPLRNVLNLFERARSTLLGGSDELKRLQNEYGILAVVTGMTDCSLIDEDTMVYPGQTVLVATSCIIKRKGMVVECYQTLLTKEKNRLAQGIITLMMVDSVKGRPTSNLPDWLVPRLQGLS